MRNKIRKTLNVLHSPALIFDPLSKQNSFIGVKMCQPLFSQDSRLTFTRHTWTQNICPHIRLNVQQETKGGKETSTLKPIDQINNLLSRWLQALSPLRLSSSEWLVHPWMNMSLKNTIRCRPAHQTLTEAPALDLLSYRTQSSWELKHEEYHTAAPWVKTKQYACKIQLVCMETTQSCHRSWTLIQETIWWKFNINKGHFVKNILTHKMF